MRTGNEEMGGSEEKDCLVLCLVKILNFHRTAVLGSDSKADDLVTTVVPRKIDERHPS